MFPQETKRARHIFWEGAHGRLRRHDQSDHRPRHYHDTRGHSVFRMAALNPRRPWMDRLCRLPQEHPKGEEHRLMQIKIKRSQTTSGMISKTVKFCADIRAEYTAEERANINKYSLGGDVIYDSKKATQHREMAAAVGPSLRALAHMAL